MQVSRVFSKKNRLGGIIKQLGEHLTLMLRYQTAPLRLLSVQVANTSSLHEQAATKAID